MAPGKRAEHEYSRFTADPILDKEAWHQTVEEAVAAAHSTGSQVAVVFIDIDQMKLINDSLGHEAGDKAIEKVRRSIRKNLRLGETGLGEMRKVDVIGHNPVFEAGKLGGDEFGILCKTDEKGAITLAGRLRSTLAEEIAQDARLHDLEVSIGISVLQPGMTSSELLRLADNEMYEDKLGHMPELNEAQKAFLRQVDEGLKYHNLRLRDLGKHLLRLSRESES
ncbi:GGDEF domain-containing protein [Candidatus Saccharibacteria bacterium]|nr:GGDEF domain-containing protein [Candidatus Saccharibacteria bacterium]